MAALEKFVRDQSIPPIRFEKGQRQDDVAAQSLQQKGVLFAGKAPKKCTIYRTEKRRNPRRRQELLLNREVSTALTSVMTLN